MTRETPDRIDQPLVAEPSRDPESGISTRTYLHVDTNRRLYALSDSEIQELQFCSDNLAKDFCLLAGGVALPTILNSWAIYDAGVTSAEDSANEYTPGTNLILNFTVALVAAIFCCYFGIQWYRTKTSLKMLIKNIKDKPLLNDRN